MSTQNIGIITDCITVDEERPTNVSTGVTMVKCYVQICALYSWPTLPASVNEGASFDVCVEFS